MVRKKKGVTTEDLARMVQRGFAETAKKVEVDKQFADIRSRLDKIEGLILANHKRRIERLEREMKEIKEALAL